MNFVSDCGMGPNVATSSGRIAARALGNVEDLHDLVAVVVNDLDGDLVPLSGGREGARGGLVHRFPSFRIDVRLERHLEPLIGVVAPSEVAMTHEERLAVVVGVDHPESDLAGVIASYFARRRVVDVNTLQV